MAAWGQRCSLCESVVFDHPATLPCRHLYHEDCLIKRIALSPSCLRCGIAVAPSGVTRVADTNSELAQQCEGLQRELAKSQEKCERLQRQLQAAHLRIGFLTRAASGEEAGDELGELRRESAHVLGLLRDKEKQEEDVDCELSKLRAEVARLVGLGTGKENSALKRKSDSALTPETKRRKAVMGDQNVLYTTPSGELVTARRDSRAKFLRIEKAQLKAYASELEGSLGASKWMLKELGAAQALLDKQFLQRILNSLKAENAVVEERIQKVRVEKSEALIKSEHFSHQISDFQRREAADEDPLEALMREKRAIHAEKELKVQAIDARCNYLARELLELQTSAVQTPTAEATDLMLCDKFARLKEIYEKLLRELEKTENDNEELEQRQQDLTTQLEKVNAALVRPVPCHQLKEVRQVCPRAVFQNVEFDIADQAPPALLTKQLEVLQSNQQKRTISQLLALPTGAFQSSGEEKYDISRLTHEVAKLKDRIKDTQVKLETLADQLQSSKRQRADLEQDRYRLSLVLDSLQRQRYGDAFGRRGKAVSGLPPTPRRRKKVRANSNPLEYAENVCESPEQPPVLDVPEVSDNEVEMDLEMPSIICGNDQDEFLQGDSFLLDALHL